MSAIDYIPARASLTVLRRAVQLCRGCPLYQGSTQAVFGEGRTHARPILLGEQPGNQEDIEGKPFVGPAGQLLESASPILYLEAHGTSRGRRLGDIPVQPFHSHRRFGPATIRGLTE